MFGLKIISTIIKIMLIGYSVYIAPKLSDELIVLFEADNLITDELVLYYLLSAPYFKTKPL